MFKCILLILALMLSGITPCNAADPVSIPSENLVINNFDIGKIADLSHPVCALSLAENKEKGFYNYTEGGVCPVTFTGKECPNSAIMKLNGKITILEQVSSDKNTTVYKNDDMTIISTQTPIKGSGDDEGGDVNAVIVIKTKNGEKKVNMSGYCGI